MDEGHSFDPGDVFVIKEDGNLLRLKQDVLDENPGQIAPPDDPEGAPEAAPDASAQ